MKYLLITILIFIFSCRSAKIIQEANRCEEGAPIEVSRSKSLFFKEKSHFIVMFADGFDGNTQLFVNNELIFDKNIKTDFSISSAGITDFAMNEDAILKIYTEMEVNNCLEFKLDRRYSAILVYRFVDKWILRYSNQKVFYVE